MRALILKRLLHAVPVVWAAASIIWVLVSLIPGDPALLIAGRAPDPEVLAQVRSQWGLDRPAPERYGRFLLNLARFDLGPSYMHAGVPVSELVGRALARTLSLALAGALLAALAGLAIGVAWSRARGRPARASWLALTTIGVSLPTFWTGLMLILLFASTLRWLPVSGFGPGRTLLGFPFPAPSYLILPAATLVIYYGSYLARVARAALLEESSQEYARAALARGASPARALGRHMLPNALLPVVTLAGLIFGHLLGAAVATETVFNWPGLGSLLFNAIADRNLPVIEGGVIVLTATFVMVNLLTDLSYGLIDPRARG